MDLQIEVLRLQPGEDLQAALATCLCGLTVLRDGKREPAGAACVVAAVGSLSQAVLRYANEPQGSLLAMPLELLTLSGTLGLDGLHLHASVADAQGRVYGGHLMPGCTVRTTAEIVLGLLPNFSFERAIDPATGYRELVSRRI